LKKLRKLTLINVNLFSSKKIDSLNDLNSSIFEEEEGFPPLIIIKNKFNYPLWKEEHFKKNILPFPTTLIRKENSNRTSSNCRLILSLMNKCHHY